MEFKVYKIINPDFPNKVYYGSTIQPLITRFQHHKCHQSCKSGELFKTENASIHLLDVAKNKEEMVTLERWWIEIDDECLNTVVPKRTIREYYQDKKYLWDKAIYQRIECSCGVSVRKNAIKRHLKSANHIKKSK